MQNDALELLSRRAYASTIAGFPGHFTLTRRIMRPIAEEIVDFDGKLLAVVSELGKYGWDDTISLEFVFMSVLWLWLFVVGLGCKKVECFALQPSTLQKLSFGHPWVK